MRLTAKSEYGVLAVDRPRLHTTGRARSARARSPSAAAFRRASSSSCSSRCGARASSPPCAALRADSRSTRPRPRSPCSTSSRRSKARLQSSVCDQRAGERMRQERVVRGRSRVGTRHPCAARRVRDDDARTRWRARKTHSTGARAPPEARGEPAHGHDLLRLRSDHAGRRARPRGDAAVLHRALRQRELPLRAWAATPTARSRRLARRVAAGIGAASPDEVIFTSGGTESDNTALIGILTRGRARTAART